MRMSSQPKSDLPPTSYHSVEDMNLEPLERRLLLSVDTLPFSPSMSGDLLPDQIPGTGLERIFEAYLTSVLNDPLGRPTAQSVESEASTCIQLETGLNDLRKALPGLFAGFDLSAPGVPVLPNTLNQLFDLSGQVANHALNLLPDIGSNTTVQQLVDSLGKSGYEVTGVQGGLGSIAATTDGSLIEARLLPGTGLTVGPSASYRGDTFDNATDSLLKGLNSQAKLAADWGANLGATLNLTAVFGVDANGFFLRADGFSLSTAVKTKTPASLSGTATIGGQAGLALTGSANVDLTVKLALKAGTPTLNLAALTSHFAAGDEIERWQGTAGVSLNFALNSSTLVFKADYTGSFEQPAPTAPALTLTGKITLPNVVDATGKPVSLDLQGKLNPTGQSWTLTGRQTPGQTLKLHQFELNGLALALTIDATHYGDSGATSGTVSILPSALDLKWLPLTTLSSPVTWAEINGAAVDFKVTINATIDGVLPGTTLGIKGTLTGLTLALGEGKLQILSLEKLELKIPTAGLAGEATLEGAIIGGLLRVDAAGKVIAANDTTTVVAKRMVYGLLDGSLLINGYGFGFRVGLCDLGLISAYFKVDAPLPIGGETGISITSLWGEISFGTELPVPADAKALASKSLAPADKMSDAQWEAKCLAAMVGVLSAGDGSVKDEFKALLTHFTIEGGISIADVYAKGILSLDGTMQIDTAGHLIVGGTINLVKLGKPKDDTAVEGQKKTAIGQLDASLYFDLAALEAAFKHSGTATPHNALMIHADVTNTKLKTPPVTLYGDLSLADLTASDPAIAVSGGAILSADGFVNLELDSTSTFRVLDETHYEFEIDGTATVTKFGNFAGIDGKLKVDVDNQGVFLIYGALVLKPENLQKLKKIGLDLDGLALWSCNFTTGDRQVTLTIPDANVPTATYNLPASSIGLLLEGTVTFNQLVSDWMVFHGRIDLYETADSIDLVLDGEVLFGPSGRIAPDAIQADALVAFTTLGYLHIDLDGIAGALTLKITTGIIPEALALTANGEVELRINTTGKDLSFTVPTAVKQLYPQLVIPQELSLPGIPPEILRDSLGHAPAAWAEVALNGTLKFGDAIVITGDFALMASTERLEVKLAQARIGLGLAGAELMHLTASGSLLTDANGTVGALNVDLAGLSLPTNTIHLEGKAQWLINTTGTARTLLDGTLVPARIDGNPYTAVKVVGDLALDQPARNFLTLPGTHSLILVSNAGTPGYHVALSSDTTLEVTAGKQTFFAEDFVAAGYVDETGLAAFLTVKANSLKDPLGLARGFTSVTVGINTTASKQAVAKSGTAYVFTPLKDAEAPAAGTLATLPSLVGAQVSAHGEMALLDAFLLTGDFVFTLDDNVWTMAVDGRFELHAPDLANAGKNSSAIFSVGFKKSITLNLPGIVLDEQLDLSGGTPGVLGITPSGTVSLVVNTTKVAAGLAAGLPIPPTSGQLSLADAEWRIAGFTMSGAFTFQQKALSALSASGNFEVKLVAAGTVLLSSHGQGDFHVGFDGLAGVVDIAKPTLLGMEFQSGAQQQSDPEFFRLAFNTSSSAFTVGGEVIAAGPYAVAHLHSTLNFLKLDALVLTGNFDLNSRGQLTIDASLDAYLVSKKIDAKPLASFAVVGSLTHNAQATTGRLELKAGVSQLGFDLPASWGVSFGRQSESLSVEFNLAYGTAPAPATLPTATSSDPSVAPADSVRLVATNRMVIGFQAIDGTFNFTWVRGQELLIGFNGSTNLGVGPVQANGDREITLIGVDLGGIIHGIKKSDGTGALFAGLEAEFHAGAVHPEFLKKLGLDDFNLGLGAKDKFYVLINTTGEAQPLDLDWLPADLKNVRADEKFALFVQSAVKIASTEFSGVFGLTVYEKGVKIQVSAVQNLSIVDAQNTNLTLTTAQLTGFLEVQHNAGDPNDPDGYSGVVAFLAANVKILDIGVAGFSLDSNNFTGVVRINTSGQAKNLATPDRLADLADVFKPYLSLPAGKFAQVIIEADWNSPPFFGIHFSNVLVLEVVRNAFVLSGTGGVKGELQSGLGVEVDLFELSGTIMAVITKDKGFALAAALEGDPLGSLKSPFFKTNDSSEHKAILQIKTFEAAMDLTPYIPPTLTHGVGALYNLEAGKYARLTAQTELSMVTAGVGFAMANTSTLEFKSEQTYQHNAARNETTKDDKYRMWVEVVGQASATTDLAFLGSLTDVTTTALYLGTDGIAFLAERDASKAGVLKKTDFDFTVKTLKLGFNTTGRDLSISGAIIDGKATASSTVSKDLLQLQFNGVFQFGAFAFAGDYLATAQKSDDQLTLVSTADLTVDHATLARADFAGLLSKNDFSVTASGQLALGEKDLAYLDGNVAIGYDVKQGFTGRVTGALSILGQKVNTIHEAFAVTGFDVPFAEKLAITLPAPVDFLTLSGQVGGHISTTGITLDDGTKVSVRIHATPVEQISFALNTAAKTWRLTGSAGSHLGDSVGPFSISLALRYSLDIEYAGGRLAKSNVSLNGEATGTVHTALHNFSTSADASATITKNSSRLTFHLSKDGFSVSFAVDLANKSLIQGSDLGGSTVFLDTNGSRQLNGSEVSITADALGYFSFADAAFTGPLGALTPHDHNGNGTIDSTEGVFVVQGGTDLHTGLPNSLQYVFSAENYGGPFQIVYSPMLQLHSNLVRHEGLTSDDAWKKIDVAFGLPSTVALEFFDHNLDESAFPDTGAYREVEAAYAEVNGFLINADAVLEKILPNRSTTEIQSTLGAQLAHVVAQQDTGGYDVAIAQTGIFDGTGATSILLDAVVVQHVIAASITQLAPAAPARPWQELIRTAAYVIAEQSNVIDLLRAADVGRFTETMALMKAEAQNGSAPQLRQVADGTLHGATFMASYGHDQIVAAITRAGFDPAELRPVVGPVADFVGTRAELHDLNLPVARFDGSVAGLTWRIESSDPTLLPVGAVQILQQGSQWILRLNPDAHHSGIVNVSLTATDASGQQSLASGFTVQVLPTVSLGALVPVVTPESAYFEIAVSVDAPSNQTVSGQFQISGSAVDGVHFAGASVSYTIVPGQSAVTIRIPFLSTPYGDAVSLSVRHDNADNGRLGSQAQSAEYLISAVPLGRIGAGAAGTVGFTPRSINATNETLLRAMGAGSHQPDSDRLQPDKMHYHG